MHMIANSSLKLNNKKKLTVNIEICIDIYIFHVDDYILCEPTVNIIIVHQSVMMRLWWTLL